jgi:class 3 adenylate cyclase
VTNNSFVNVDVESIIRASNTISEDLDKKKLLSKLNQVIVENAGATKALIILKKQDQYILSNEINNSTVMTNRIDQEITKQSDFLSLKVFNQCINRKEIVISKNAKMDANFKHDDYIQNNNVKSILCAPIMKGKSLSGVLYLENNTMEGTFTESRKFILKHILSQVAISMENSNLYEDVKTINEAYSRFLPTEFLNQLQKKDVRNVKPSDCIEKKMTVLFSDIRNFTTITDNLNAQESFAFVNEVLNELAPFISKNNGFVDKFIGDCVMAIFPNSPLDAVTSGLEMLKSMNKLNQTKESPVHIGVGIAYGDVMIGTLGYEKRLDATVISSTVNTASRMENLTKALGVNILITEEIYQQIQSSPNLFCYFVGSFYLKGQKDVKRLFGVMFSSEKNQQYFNTFNEGIQLFQSKDFTGASKIFKSLNDGISQHYLKVCRLYDLNQLPLDWKGEIKISKDGDPQQIVSNLSIEMVDKISILQNTMNDPDKLYYLFECAMKLNQQ